MAYILLALYLLGFAGTFAAGLVSFMTDLDFFDRPYWQGVVACLIVAAVWPLIVIQVLIIGR